MDVSDIEDDGPSNAARRPDVDEPASSEGMTPGERILRRLAESGDVTAVSNVGRYLRLAGRRTEAEPILRQAAEAGDANAQAMLAKLWDYD